MKWTFSIKNKMTAALVLLVLCLVIFFNNLNDRRNQSELETAIKSMYNDRLIVEDHILKLSGYMYQIAEITDNAASGTDEAHASIAKIISESERINVAYESTEFTPEETTKYGEYKVLFAKLGSSSFSMAEKKLYSKEALKVLNQLSSIQISESKSILTRSEAIFSSGKMSSQFMNTMIIVIGAILQALVLASKTTISRPVIAEPHFN